MGFALIGFGFLGSKGIRMGGLAGEVLGLLVSERSCMSSEVLGALFGLRSKLGLLRGLALLGLSQCRF